MGETKGLETADVFGWGYPTMTARKAHCFVKETHRSLCGKYAWIRGEYDEGDPAEPTPDDCAACRRKLNSLITARFLNQAFG